MVITSDRDIETWVEDEYEPEEATPAKFIRDSEFSKIRAQVARKKAESLYKQQHSDSVSRGRIVEQVDGSIRAREIKTGRFTRLTKALKAIGKRLFGIG